MTSEPEVADLAEARRLDQHASQLMQRGLQLMRQEPPAIDDALASFDEARGIRSRLPVETVPVFGYGLAACWLNRAEVLMKLGDPHVPAAVGAFDEALALLRQLPLDEDVRYRRRLAIALQNRGLAAAAGGGDTAEAVRAFEEALAALPVDAASPYEDRGLRGAVLVNLAIVLAAGSDSDALTLSREHARRAIELVADLADANADAAEIDLKARHVLCRIVAGQLFEADVPSRPVDDAVHEATDTIEDGLHLIRRREGRGDTRFRDIAGDFIRVGAGVYGRFQPHFVQEFLEEHRDLDRDRDRDATAGEQTPRHRGPSRP